MRRKKKKYNNLIILYRRGGAAVSTPDGPNIIAVLLYNSVGMRFSYHKRSAANGREPRASLQATGNQ